jgi:hypothetical protein
MDDGPNDRIGPELVLSHFARFNVSSEYAVILNLSRVSPILCIWIDLLTSVIGIQV